MILISSTVLDVSGVPIYTRTFFKELVARGHEVVVWSPNMGKLADQMNATDSLRGLKPDVIYAQHQNCAYKLRNTFPTVPMVYASHSYVVELERPPRGIEIQHYTAINEATQEIMERCRVPAEKITIVRDPVDFEEFKPTHEPRERPSVLYVSNYKKWLGHRWISQACERLGLEFHAVGSPYGRTMRMNETMDAFDLVVGWGRGPLEAMAAGRPTIVYDKEIGDGYMDTEIYFESRTRNFGEYQCRHKFTPEMLMNEIKKYDPKDGMRNRELARRYHDVKRCADKLLEVLEIASSQ